MDMRYKMRNIYSKNLRAKYVGWWQKSRSSNKKKKCLHIAIAGQNNSNANNGMKMKRESFDLMGIERTKKKCACVSYFKNQCNFWIPSYKLLIQGPLNIPNVMKFAWKLFGAALILRNLYLAIHNLFGTLWEISLEWFVKVDIVWCKAITLEFWLWPIFNMNTCISSCWNLWIVHTQSAESECEKWNGKNLRAKYV